MFKPDEDITNIIPILQSFSTSYLQELGFRQWDKVINKEGYTLWLYPATMYDFIPNGTPITDIMYREEVFEKHKTDKDSRRGMLAFGFMRKADV